MSKKPVTLWRPDMEERHPPKGFHYCVSSMCVELVREPGDKCKMHREAPSVNIHRSPRNTPFF